MIAVGIFISGERIELFEDEKISVNSSIQNINDISKVFTDYSQTFTVPASKRNNRIFKHWYENSLQDQFSTNVKVDAYIELDTILFRKGKVQLESCSIVDGKPQNYSITFLGSLASLKDKFAGLFLKDLDSNYYDFNYTANFVRDRVTDVSASQNVMFPLISSDRYWTWGSGAHNVHVNSSPIRYNELFPALRVKAVLDMIVRDSKWNIKFDGSFLTDARFTNAYLWLKNAEKFEVKTIFSVLKFETNYTNSTPSNRSWLSSNATTGIFKATAYQATSVYKRVVVNLYPTVAGISYKIELFNMTTGLTVNTVNAISVSGFQSFRLLDDFSTNFANNEFQVKISSSAVIVFDYSTNIKISGGSTNPDGNAVNLMNTASQTFTIGNLPINQYFPEIKIEDFFSGILKMFNLTCFSEDGTNFKVEQLESYYNSGTVRDITKHIKSDNIDLSRVKSFKKINFEYEKSESFVNVGFLGNNGVEYGSLLFSTGNDGEEYSIKLPFENLNFANLNDRFQVGYALKSDLSKYVPKPVILYDYFPAGTTDTANAFHFATALTDDGASYTSYKAFGQEFFDGTDFFSLNFNSQQSTITNEVITKSLYNQYYENYFANIFSYKARIYKVVAIFPISILTSLKLNDRIIIRDKKFIINTMTTDLTSGEVQLELLTDFRL